MAEWVCPGCGFWLGLPADWGDKPIACPECDLVEGNFADLPALPPVPEPAVEPMAELVPDTEADTPPVRPPEFEHEAVFLESHDADPTATRAWERWLIGPGFARTFARTFVGFVLTLSIYSTALLLTGILRAPGEDARGRRVDPGPCVWAAIVPIWFVAAGLNRYARRLRRRSAVAATRIDDRPPILLLRAFADDQLPLAGYEIEESPIGINVSTSGTFEEYLDWQLSKCGPVIACGRPGGWLPPLGAARFWVAHAHWQRVIANLLREAQYVVMILGELDFAASEGREDGLLWEANRVAELARATPERVVLVVPPVPEREAERRWENYRRVFPQLPEYRGGETAVWFDRRGRANVCRTSRRERDKRAYDLTIRVPV